MGRHDEQIQTLRAWLLAAIDEDDDAKVIVAGRSRVRPPLPYLVVGPISETLHGAVEYRPRATGVIPVKFVRLHATITAYGVEARDWLADVDLASREPLHAGGLAVESIGEMRDLPGLADTEIEERSIREIWLAREVVGAEIPEIPATSVRVVVEVADEADPDPDPIEFEIVVSED